MCWTRHHGSLQRSPMSWDLKPPLSVNWEMSTQTEVSFRETSFWQIYFLFVLNFCTTSMHYFYNWVFPFEERVGRETVDAITHCWLYRIRIQNKLSLNSEKAGEIFSLQTSMLFLTMRILKTTFLFPLSVQNV